MVAKTKAAHHAISAPFEKILDPNGKTLVVQYEVKFQKGGNCGGGYLKLLEEGYASDGQDYNDKTPWVIMFGPDLTCPGTKVFLMRDIFAKRADRFRFLIKNELGSLHLPPSKSRHEGIRGETLERPSYAYYR